MARPTPEISYSQVKGFDRRVDVGGPSWANWDYDLTVAAPINRREYIGTTTPDFRSKDKRSLPFNEFQLIKTLKGKGVLREHYYGNLASLGRTITQDFQQWGDNALSSRDSYHLDEANLLALSRLASQFNKVKTNLPLMFHERKKTADMVYHAATRLTRAVVNLKRLRFQEAFNSLNITPSKSQADRVKSIMSKYRRKDRYDDYDAFPNAWMELRYGWMPTVNDIFGAVELLAEKYRREAGIRYWAKSSGTAYGHIPVYFVPGPIYLDPGRLAGYTKRKTSTKYIAFYRLDNDSCEKLHETGITNPLLFAWDAFPFSFVADWFIPVSQWLENMQAYTGFEFSEVRRVDFTRASVDVAISSFSSGTEYGGPWVKWYDLNWFQEMIRYNRSASLSRPPSIPFILKDPVSVANSVTALSILWQQLRGSSRG